MSFHSPLRPNNARLEFCTCTHGARAILFYHINLYNNFAECRQYILDLLAEVGMHECKPANTPVIQNLKLGMDPNQSLTNKETY